MREVRSVKSAHLDKRKFCNIDFGHLSLLCCTLKFSVSILPLSADSRTSTGDDSQRDVIDHQMFCVDHRERLFEEMSSERFGYNKEAEVSGGSSP